MAHDGRKTADEPLAAALATGLSVANAAARAGVSERTVFRRLDDPTFVARVDELRASLVCNTLERVTGGMSEAVDKLRELLAHKDASVQVRAAVTLLANGIRLREHAEMADRIEKLERLIAAQAAAGGSR